jgi:hypothetical protein
MLACEDVTVHHHSAYCSCWRSGREEDASARQGRTDEEPELWRRLSLAKYWLGKRRG